MTRDQFHSLPGFHVETIHNAIAYLRAELKPTRTAAEPTALIAAGAEVNGYLKAIEALISVTQPKAEPVEKKKIQPYGSPQFPTENQNRP